MSLCVIPNCVRKIRSPSRIWGVSSRYCESHRWRWRVHGDARQEAVKTQDLKPLIDSARRIIARDSSGKLNDVLTRLHAGLKDYALGVRTDIEGGKRAPQWTARGAEQVAKVITQTDPIDCACVIISVFMLREDQFWNFVSRRGFAFQLVRAFRKQAELAWGKYWDDKQSLRRSVYKEITPRCVEAIASLLVYTYAKLASRIITLYQEERTQPMKDNKTIDEVFDSLALTKRVDPADTEGDEPQGARVCRTN